MPGILPMKVIKVGNNNQSRIAQACDRCRSKKIRCDGIRPCCSQCANVGFECKTSDKLSRRAFPRGYTESLEERVRALEAEVRELKDLLDEKDEKIDMLSKMHSHRRPSHSSITTTPSLGSRETSQSPIKEDTFKVQASPVLVGSENSDSFFMGASSGRAFVDAFKRKIQESGKSCSDINADGFLNIQDVVSVDGLKSPPSSTVPPRMFSDRCVNIFFQEWAPLFPVIHRPSFLKLYEEYVTNPDTMTDNQKLAQLHLVFSVAALSSELPDRQYIESCERQWQSSLDLILMGNTLMTLQLLVLAMLYCISKGDYKRLQHYKGVAVGLSHRLGLHQSQKRFAFGALTTETRKKVFWSLYTVDCFSAAMLGLPKLLKEEDVHCEYPTDIDDEYITENGFSPTLPGEASKISNALALFRASRILAKVLHQIYPAAAVHDLSLHQLSILESEINEWSDELPSHLKLTFVQDKPSTNVTGSRSALLSLAYYYIKGLIHRPAIGSSLGNKASPSVICLADSSKHIIQIVQLLEERNMSFSFCLNRSETLTLCGLSLLYQGIDLKQGSSIVKDGQRLVSSVVGYLKKYNAPGVVDFQKLVASMVPVESKSSRRSSDNNMAAPNKTKSAASPSMARKDNFQYGSRQSNDLERLQAQQERLRRATVPNIPVNALGRHSNGSQSSLESAVSDNPMSRRDLRQPSSTSLPATSPTKRHASFPSSKPNLDYMSLSNTPSGSQPQSPMLHRTPKTHTPIFPGASSANIPTPTQSQKLSSVSAAEWESLLSSLDNGTTNIYDAVYGGPAISLSTHPGVAELQQASSMTSGSVYGVSPSDWSPEQWDLTSLSMNEFDLALNGGQATGQAQSVLSFSEESLSSGDELFPGAAHSIVGARNAQRMMAAGGRDAFLLDGLDGNFGL